MSRTEQTLRILDVVITLVQVYKNTYQYQFDFSLSKYYWSTFTFSMKYSSSIEKFIKEFVVYCLMFNNRYTKINFITYLKLTVIFRQNLQ